MSTQVPLKKTKKKKKNSKSEIKVNTVHTMSNEEELSMKTAPIEDSTISARAFGASMSPLECNGYSKIPCVNFRICTYKEKNLKKLKIIPNGINKTFVIS